LPRRRPCAREPPMPDKEPEVLAVMLGPAGLAAFLLAYREADDGADVTIAVAEGPSGQGMVVLLAVDGFGTALPLDRGPPLAEELAKQAEVPGCGCFAKLSRAVLAICDEAAARFGPKH